MKTYKYFASVGGIPAGGGYDWQREVDCAGSSKKCSWPPEQYKVQIIFNECSSCFYPILVQLKRKEGSCSSIHNRRLAKLYQAC